MVGNTSGYSEGWALYAERLMDELGYFSDLGDELGYLANQALRAARIVIDPGKPEMAEVHNIIKQ